MEVPSDSCDTTFEPALLETPPHNLPSQSQPVEKYNTMAVYDPPSSLHLPDELLLLIVQEVKDRKTLASLSSCCQSLHGMVKPLLYSKVHINARALPFFLRTILTDMALVRYVKCFVVASQSNQKVDTSVLNKELIGWAQKEISKLGYRDPQNTRDWAAGWLFLKKKYVLKRSGGDEWLEILLSRGSCESFRYLAECFIPNDRKVEEMDDSNGNVDGKCSCGGDN